MASSRKKTNTAFTLVELLVVIAILGVLMALLLPAVNSVRESARRTQCKNNLAQIGVAASAFIGQYQYFPSGGWGMGWLGDPDRGAGARQPGSWIYQLLPFMGLDMVHDLGKGQGNGALSNFTSSYKYTTGGPAMKTSALPLFICPTRRKAIVYPDLINQGANNSALAGGLNHSDYCANTGTGDAGDSFFGPSLNCMSTYPNCSWDGDAAQGNGVVFQASQVRPSAITDGLTNTLFAGEKWHCVPLYYTSAEAGDDNSMMQGFDHDVIRWTGLSYPPLQDSLTTAAAGCTTNGTSYWCQPQDFSFGSAHSAGVNFVFCDGHVVLISYSINMTTYTAMGCINYVAMNPGYIINDTF